MGIINLNKKRICLLLIFSMILHSCSVYKNESITIDEAIIQKSRVRVTTKSGDKVIIRKIEKVNSVYYGEVKTPGYGFSREILNETDYVKIQPKDKELSIVLTAGLIILPFAGLFAAMLISVNNMEINPTL